MLGCLGRGRDLRPRRPLRPARRAAPAPGRALHGRLPRLRPDLARGARPPALRRVRPQPRCGSSRTSPRPSGCATSSGGCPGRRQSRRSARPSAASNLTLARRRRPRADAHRARSARRRPGMEIKIVDPETGEELPPGEDRRALLARLRAVRGLLQGSRADGRRRSTPTAGSTPATSARWTSDGRLVYAGRLKDMLKVGGENVSALEVEDYLVAPPGGQHRRRSSPRRTRATRGAGRVRRAAAGRDALTEERADRLLRRPDRDVQGAALRPLRRRSGRCRGRRSRSSSCASRSQRSSRSAGSPRRRRSRAR